MEKLRALIAALGGRRFLATMISGAGTWVLAYTGHIDGTAYQWTTIGIVGAFITGSTAQKIQAPEVAGTNPPQAPENRG